MLEWIFVSLAAIGALINYIVPIAILVVVVLVYKKLEQIEQHLRHLD